MVINYSREASFSVAIQRTFDGRNACRLCTAVRVGQSSAQKTVLMKFETKLDFPVVRNAVRVDPLLGAETAPVPFLTAPHRVDSPPTPPPRWA